MMIDYNGKGGYVTHRLYANNGVCVPGIPVRYMSLSTSHWRLSYLDARDEPSQSQDGATRIYDLS